MTKKRLSKKIKSAVTDSEGIIKYNKETKPAISNLLSIFSLCTGKSNDELEKEFSGKGYGAFKQALAEAVVATLKPIHERYYNMIDSKELDDILDLGAQKANLVALKTLTKAKQAMGLGRKF
jgi:tryptophanyl-tRNA synthetase